MVEAHQRDMALVAFQRFEHRVGKTLVVALAALEFEDERHAALDESQQLAERRHFVGRAADGDQPSSPAVFSRTSPLMPQSRCMSSSWKTTGTLSARILQVAFDGEAVLDRAGKGRERVFPDGMVHVVIAAMGDRLRRQPGKIFHGDAIPLCDFDDGVDFDGGIEGQGGHADGGAGMDAGVAENLGDQVGGAVDDEMLFDEGRAWRRRSR